MAVGTRFAVGILMICVIVSEILLLPVSCLPSSFTRGSETCVSVKAGNYL